jgi:hypothetical protein
MKRVGVAVVLLLAVSIGCFLALRTEKRLLSSLLTQTAQVEQLYRQEYKAEAITATEQLADNTQRTLRRCACLLPHSTLTEISVLATALPVILKDGNQDDFLTELSKFRMLLTVVKQMEYPYLENIL